jgi:hypothetical protein
MLTRWAAPSTRARISAVMVAPLSPALDSDFDWPSPTEIRRLHDASLTPAVSASETEKELKISLGSEGLYKGPSNAVWIPSEASDMQLRICIVAHTGIGGHRGFKATLDTIQSKFSWHTMTADIKSFCNSCLHCCSTIGGDRTPRPKGEAIHATLPNEVINFDFLFLGPSKTGEKYLLLIKDDCRGTSGTFPANTQTSQRWSMLSRLGSQLSGWH